MENPGFTQSENGIEISVPPDQRSDIDTVIALELDEPADAITPVAVDPAQKPE